MTKPKSARKNSNLNVPNAAYLNVSTKGLIGSKKSGPSSTPNPCVANIIGSPALLNSNNEPRPVMQSKNKSSYVQVIILIQ